MVTSVELGPTFQMDNPSFGGIDEDELILAMAETRKRQQNVTSKVT
jgi:hypothetical protein